MKQAQTLHELRKLPWSPQLEKRISYIKRRGLARNYTHQPEVRLAVFSRDHFQCQQCGSPEHLTVDHILSVYRGGTDDFDNLQTLCNPCNAGKSP
ncbi:MAG: HNH endonuclease [Dehalococcoidia bacterium]|nr:MAG: HNH endonuclease [Dehalococcoidia bacterium]